jgi:hypothetical protein
MGMKLTDAEIQSICLSVEGLTESGELALLYRLCFQAPDTGWFVELGSYMGRSSAAICQGAHELGHEVMLIDNFTPIIKRGWQDKHGTVELLGANMKRLGYKPLIVDGDSRQVPGVFPKGAKVSYLFIDSNHDPLHFEQEWDTWKGHLLPGAIIACHDYANPKCAGLAVMIYKLLGHLDKIDLVDSTIAFKWGGL